MKQDTRAQEHHRLLDKYADKPADYFGAIQHLILPYLPSFSEKCLEVGCGSGATLGWLKEIGRIKEAYGFELVAEAAAKAALVADRVEVGNLEHGVLPFEDSSIDLILALDVLEHLVQPKLVLQQLSKLLKPGGVLIAKMPNARHHRLVYQLVVKGDWKYEEHGILDETHLRFYTHKSLPALFENSGILIEKNEALPFLSKADKMNKLTFGLFSDFLTKHYIVVARRPRA
jgi:SAM-dependent methyltransferase